MSERDPNYMGREGAAGSYGHMKLRRDLGIGRPLYSRKKKLINPEPINTTNPRIEEYKRSGHPFPPLVPDADFFKLDDDIE